MLSFTELANRGLPSEVPASWKQQMNSHTKKSVPSKIDELLDSLDLGRARTSNELGTLFDEISVAFESEELSKMSRHSQTWAKYIEVVLPLTHLARWLFPGCLDVRYQPNLGDSGNYDAVITLPNEGNMPVEFTYAKSKTSGYEDSLRMEVLNNKGRVNMLGEVTHSGTKNTGHCIEICDEVVPRPRILENHQRLIIDRIKAKASKKYSPAHILVVVFDDYVGFNSDQEIADLKSSIASAIDLPALEFSSLYLLGYSGKTFSELPAHA